MSLQDIKNLADATIQKLLAKTMRSKIIKSRMFPKNWEAPNDEYTPPWAVPCQSECTPAPTLRQIGIERVVGRKIVRASCHWGTYGMGGSGFVALIMEETVNFPREAVVLTLWCADAWLHFNDKLIDNNFGKDVTAIGYKEFEKAIEGATITSFEIHDKHCKMRLQPVAAEEITADYWKEIAPSTPGFSGEMVLELKEDPGSRLPHGGNGEPRELAPDDSLWDAWVITETQLLV